MRDNSKTIILMEKAISIGNLEKAIKASGETIK